MDRHQFDGIARALANQRTRRGAIGALLAVLAGGALTEAVAVQPGDSIVARFDRLGTVEIACR